MSLGLLIGNFVDLDHIYLRLIGKVGWFESACPQGFGSQCSFGIYPLHSLGFASVLIILSIIFLIPTTKNKKWKSYQRLLFWISIGALVNFALDLIHLFTGFGF